MKETFDGYDASDEEMNDYASGSDGRSSSSDLIDKYEDEIDILTPLMLIFPVAKGILIHLDSYSSIRLLNVSPHIRQQLVRIHFRQFRRLVILKDENYQKRFSSWQWLPDLNDISSQEWIKRSEWPQPEEIFFRNFTDYSFEEFLLNKLLEIPPELHPTADFHLFKTLGIGRVITSLVLDGTDVSGTGLFGRMYIDEDRMPARATPGLLSYFSANLQELSIRYCPNVEHADIAIFLLMPPTNDVALKKLRRLWAYSCGEAPAVGPFHNKPGHGSKHRVARDADHILNIQVLKILFPIGLPFEHHICFSIPLLIPYNLPYLSRCAMVNPLRQQLIEQYQVGWFAPQNMFSKPGVCLLNKNSQKMVPGPWGGELATLHETMMLSSISRYKNITFDWGLCMNGDKCHGWTSEEYRQITQINVRTGRILAIGNMFGDATKDQGGRQTWWCANNGPIARIPQELIPGNVPVHLACVADKEEQEDPEATAEVDESQMKEKPKYVSLMGLKDAPSLMHEYKKETIIAYGLQGAGIHTHSGAGWMVRAQRGGHACANCGLWETQHSITTFPNGKTIMDMGRFYPSGELCEICVPQQTCRVCGDFYCSNCVKPPEYHNPADPGFLSNPFQFAPPNKDFLINTCSKHGVHCPSCLSCVQTACKACGRFLCMDCYDTGDLDVFFEQCRECEHWWCMDCLFEDGLEICQGERCQDIRGGLHLKADGRNPGCCEPCLKATCRMCGSGFCAKDYQIMHIEYHDKFQIDLPPLQMRETICIKCFSKKIPTLPEDLKIAAWAFIGVNLKAREAQAEEDARQFEEEDSEDENNVKDDDKMFVDDKVDDLDETMRKTLGEDNLQVSSLDNMDSLNSPFSSPFDASLSAPASFHLQGSAPSATFTGISNSLNVFATPTTPLSMPGPLDQIVIPAHQAPPPGIWDPFGAFNATSVPPPGICSLFGSLKHAAPPNIPTQLTKTSYSSNLPEVHMAALEQTPSATATAIFTPFSTEKFQAISNLQSKLVIEEPMLISGAENQLAATPEQVFPSAPRKPGDIHQAIDNLTVLLAQLPLTSTVSSVRSQLLQLQVELFQPVKSLVLKDGMYKDTSFVEDQHDSAGLHDANVKSVPRQTLQMTPGHEVHVHKTPWNEASDHRMPKRKIPKTEVFEQETLVQNTSEYDAPEHDMSVEETFKPGAEFNRGDLGITLLSDTSLEAAFQRMLQECSQYSFLELHPNQQMPTDLSYAIVQATPIANEPGKDAEPTEGTVGTSRELQPSDDEMIDAPIREELLKAKNWNAIAQTSPKNSINMQLPSSDELDVTYLLSDKEMLESPIKIVFEKPLQSRSLSPVKDVNAGANVGVNFEFPFSHEIEVNIKLPSSDEADVTSPSSDENILKSPTKPAFMTPLLSLSRSVSPIKAMLPIKAISTITANNERVVPAILSQSSIIFKKLVPFSNPPEILSSPSQMESSPDEVKIFPPEVEASQIPLPSEKSFVNQKNFVKDPAQIGWFFDNQFQSPTENSNLTGCDLFNENGMEELFGKDDELLFDDVLNDSFQDSEWFLDAVPDPLVNPFGDEFEIQSHPNMTTRWPLPTPPSPSSQNREEFHLPSLSTSDKEKDNATEDDDDILMGGQDQPKQTLLSGRKRSRIVSAGDGSGQLNLKKVRKDGSI